jgi:hypothetical protein
VRGFAIRQISCAVILASWITVACGRADKRPAAESAASPASARALVSARGVKSARSYPGALTKPIDQYTGDELFALTQGLKYAGSHERERKCKDSPGCDGSAPTKKTLVQVSAIATQDSLSAGDAPEFGVVYLRAINRGDATEARYGMRRGNSLRYYMIVQRDSAGGLTWRLEELDTTPPRKHTSVGTGVFQGCTGHEQHWTPGASADFKTCEQAERSDTVVTLGLALQEVQGDPMWVRCSTGCCILQ